MSITRRKPRTVKETQMGLVKAKAKKDTVAPADMTLTDATQTAVDDTNTSFLALIAAMVLALFNQLLASNLKDAAQKLARMFVSHYFQAFNNGIDRGVFIKESRVLYGLSENQSAVPSIGSEADLTYWGGKVFTGDAARVTAGGAAMSNPTAAEVTTKVTDFNTKNNNQSNKKVSFGNAEADVKTALSDAINVVMKVWDETETFYNNLPKETMRAKAREWGTVYETDVKTTINLTTKDKATGALLPGVITTVIESGTEYTSNAAGETTIETFIAFGITLESVLADYATIQTPLEFETGVTSYNVTVLMPAV